MIGRCLTQNTISSAGCWNTMIDFDFIVLKSELGGSRWRYVCVFAILARCEDMITNSLDNQYNSQRSRKGSAHLGTTSKHRCRIENLINLVSHLTPLPLTNLILKILILFTFNCITIMFYVLWVKCLVNEYNNNPLESISEKK